MSKILKFPLSKPVFWDGDSESSIYLPSIRYFEPVIDAQYRYENVLINDLSRKLRSTIRIYRYIY
jgi:hypothetical protein